MILSGAVGTTVQSVERAFSILEAFDEQHPARSASDIAEATGLARPTTYRMLQTLRQLGYVRNVSGRFEVTPRVLRLGAGYLGRESIAARSQPSLDRLCEELGEHVAIGVLDGDGVIAVAASSSPQSRMLAIAIQPGQRLPASATSLGRILLAYNGATDSDEAAGIRDAGFVVSDGLLETGLLTMGVPVRDHTGHVVAALSVAVNSARFTVEELEQQCLPRLRATAIHLSSII